ncbi:MAG: alpha/beta family hydrolase [Bryobacteraceae bacterium]|nr:alpha/beta family hydrolase [Bryobacteraceae bacterium]
MIKDGLVLTHGAGGDSRSSLLVAVARAFEQAGVLVQLYDLPFRQKRATGGPHPSGAAADRDGLRQAAAEMRKRVSGRVFLGGQSYGGRQASILAAEDSTVVDGLLLLSYPLHPPGKPEQLRTAHFPALRTPCVFVQGTRDPFGSVEELRQAIPLIDAPVAHVIVDDAGHDLKRGMFDATPAIRALLGFRIYDLDILKP